MNHFTKQLNLSVVCALLVILSLAGCQRHDITPRINPKGTASLKSEKSQSFASIDLMSGNPILPDYTADPEILYANGRYYMYITANTGPGNSQFHAWSSVDLLSWIDEGVVFDLGPQCAWANVDGWAPCVVFRDGYYYFYYTAEKKIGVARGTSPLGPFTDRGSYLATGSPDGIDPEVMIDIGGQAYLYWGNTTLFTQRLTADMMNLTGTRVTTKPANYFEGAELIRRGNTYYMFYSINPYWENDYHVEYATSTNPMGPWTMKGRLTTPAPGMLSPGHNAVFRKPGCVDEFYTVYNRRIDPVDGGHRQVAIERLFFTDAGNVMPIKLTTSGVAQIPTGQPCMPDAPLYNGIYTIVSKVTTATGQPLVLDRAGCNPANGYLTTGLSSTCQAQRWQAVYQGNGYYKFINQQPLKSAMDGENCALARGARVGVHTNTAGSDCQLFRIEPMGGGWNRIVARASNNVVSIFDSSNSPGGNVGLWTWDGSDHQLWKFTAPEAPEFTVVSGDYNGDGVTDKAVWRNSTATWTINGVATPFGNPGDIPAPADYNGDGKTDIVNFRPSTGYWYSHAGLFTPTLYGSPGDIPIPADYTGDGKAELSVFRPSPSGAVWYNIGNVAFPPTTYGNPDDLPIPRDYNGDGKADIAVYRKSSAGWYSKDGVFTNMFYGNPNDTPIPLDYNNDGKADIAVYRPSTADWYSYGTLFPNGAYGVANDLPAPGRYVAGSTAVQKAVFRPSNQTWHVQ